MKPLDLKRFIRVSNGAFVAEASDFGSDFAPTKEISIKIGDEVESFKLTERNKDAEDEILDWVYRPNNLKCKIGKIVILND